MKKKFQFVLLVSIPLKKELPEYSIANGFDYGKPDQLNLPVLSIAEEKLISKSIIMSYFQSEIKWNGISKWINRIYNWFWTLKKVWNKLFNKIEY